MPTVILCEKPQQAKDIRAALGTGYGEITAASGHLLMLEQPEDVNPEWKKWTTEILIPQSGRYRHVPSPDPYKKKVLADIKDKLKHATDVIIATDPDREGQGIGQSLIQFLGFKGTVRRVTYVATDPKTLQTAFGNIADNKKFQGLYNAFVARQQIDRIYGYTLTRTATVAIRPDGWREPLGVGRVKTATLAILCMRELTIRNFVPRTYYDISLTVQGDKNQATLFYRPADEHRIFDQETAERISTTAAGYHGPISVTTSRKSQSPPQPHSLTSLTKAAGRHNLSPSQTLELAQSLYEVHKIITYPRSEVRHLPENFIPDAAPLLDQLRQIPAYNSYPLTKPVIRKGKKGVFSDKALEEVPHHAIIPNINCPGGIEKAFAKLNPREAAVFDEIARTFLKSIGEDYIYDRTTISIQIDLPDQSPGTFKFAISGATPLSPGWKALNSHNDDEDDDETSNILPPIADRETVKATDSSLLESQTRPPPRFQEGTLPDEMKNAWKYVEDPEEREGLKDSDGIGTPATRAVIIEELKNQKQIAIEKRNIVPTAYGLQIYTIFRERAPRLVNPGETARMEARLSDVQAGRATPDAVIGEFTTFLETVVPEIVAAGKMSGLKAPPRKPTPAMIAFARQIAERKNITLPRGALTNEETCRAFLDANTIPLRQRAEQIAAAAGITLDPSITDNDALKEFIRNTSEALANAPATEKQIAVIEKLIKDGKEPPPSYPGAMSRAIASEYLKIHLKPSSSSKPPATGTAGNPAKVSSETHKKKGAGRPLSRKPR